MKYVYYVRYTALNQSGLMVHGAYHDMHLPWEISCESHTRSIMSELEKLVDNVLPDTVILDWWTLLRTEDA